MGSGMEGVEPKGAGRRAGQGSAKTGAPTTGDKRLGVLAVLALVTNFLWFDLSLQGQSAVAGETGFSLFLAGLVVAGAAAVGFPRAMSKLGVAVCALSGVLGFAFAACLLWVPAAGAVACVVTGVSNVVLLLYATVWLAGIVDRTFMSACAVAVFALRGLGFYFIDSLCASGMRSAMLLAAAASCAVLTLTLGVLERRGCVGRGTAEIPFEPAVSSMMWALLCLAAMVFAITATASGFAGWRTGVTGEIGVMHMLLCAVLFVCLAVATLVRTKAGLLMRFMPGLIVLLAVNAFLALGIGETFDAGESLAGAFEFQVEQYGEAYAWIVMLYAIRKLETEPLRIVGCFIVTEGLTELVLRAFALLGTQAGSAVVMLGVLVVFSVLVWSLCQLYELAGRSGGDQCGECPYKCAAFAGATTATSAQTAEEETGACIGEMRLSEGSTKPRDEADRTLRSLARSHGLSPRETDVFLLLARGNSRRHICDELFIADGTVSTHINRIYDKFGVRSKQELISLVQKM